jgi:hypothetical protein
MMIIIFFREFQTLVFAVRHVRNHNEKQPNFSISPTIVDETEGARKAPVVMGNSADISPHHFSQKTGLQ